MGVMHLSHYYAFCALHEHSKISTILIIHSTQGITTFVDTLKLCYSKHENHFDAYHAKKLPLPIEWCKVHQQHSIIQFPLIID